MYVNKKEKRSIEFDKIRNGTVFMCDGITYLKGDGVYAVNMETGHVNEIAPGSTAWEECYIYPGASLKLD